MNVLNPISIRGGGGRGWSFQPRALLLASNVFVLKSISPNLDCQLAKFQCCRLSVASFLNGLRKKHNDDVIMSSFHVVGI